MPSKPKISVIIPSYNYARYLPECINSLHQQTFSDWEAVIVDDGSTDNTEEVALELVSSGQSKVHYHRVENGGVARARNIACEKAEGEFLLPLDADDLLTPDALEKFLEALLSDDKYGYSYSALENYQCLPGEGRAWLPGPFFRKWILNENNAACTGLFRKSLFEDGVRYEELIHEDWDFWLQIVSRGLEGAYVPEPLLLYRSHPEGRHSTNRHLYMLTFFEEVRKHPGLYDQKLQEAATRALHNLPEALTKPSVVFLISDSASPFYSCQGPLYQIAQDAIASGFFVAAIGSWNTAPEQSGFVVLNTLPDDDFERRAERLGMLGAKLIVFHDGSKRDTALLRTYENVALTVSTASVPDAVVGAQIDVTDNTLSIRRTSSETITIRSDDLLSMLVAKAHAQGNVGLVLQNRARAAIKSIDLTESESAEQDRSVAAIAFCGDASVETGLQIFQNRSLENYVGSIAIMEEMRAEIGGRHDNLIPGRADMRWSRSAVANEALRSAELSSGCKWLCFFDSDTSIDQSLLNAVVRYEESIPEAVVMAFAVRRGTPEVHTSEAQQQMSARSRSDFPADVECGGMFVSREWIVSVGGFVEPLRTLSAMLKDLELRAKLTDKVACWLPGEATKDWTVPPEADEWHRYDEAVLAGWRSSEVPGFQLPQGGALTQYGVVPPPVPDQETLAAHASFCLQKTEEVFRCARKGKTEVLQALFSLGLECMQRQQVRLARVLFEDALALHFELVEAWLGLGHACAHLGSIQLAGHCAAKAESLRPGDEQVGLLMSGIREVIGE
jgi:GT2 family glycosyltransferase